MPKPDSLARWRLILGRYSNDALSDCKLSAQQQRLSRSLDYLYNREYEARGDLSASDEQSSGKGASLDDSQMLAIDWLHQAQELFPQSTFERVQSHALERYGLKELLNDESVLRSLEPTPQLVKILLSMRGVLHPDMHNAVREVIRKVVDDIMARLKTQFVNHMQGRRNRFQRSFIANNQNFDWRKTIARNLKHYNPELGKLIIQEPYFNSRAKHHFPWTIVLCVDQSGSMFDSVMYSAVCASILAGLPAVSVKLLVFDTNVVDLSHLAHDPVEVLLTVQLGGGTDIAEAVCYAETVINEPHRTIFALISDFMEGGSETELFNAVQRLHQKKVKLLGLGALDENANAVYCIQTAQALSQRGMHISALTPEHFAQWLAAVMNA